MGPGGIGTTRGVPTAGLKSLLSYYGGDGPSRDSLETFIRDYLVYDGASVPDELIDLRYQASTSIRRLGRPAAAPPIGSDGVAHVVAHGPHPRLTARAAADPPVLGTRRQGRPTAGGPMLLNLMPNAELVMTSHTGHWMQWERAELFNDLVTEFLPGIRGSRDDHACIVFGDVHLGDVVVETEKFGDCPPLRRDAIGMHLDQTLPVHAVPARREGVPVPPQRGPAEDVTAIGWQLDDHNTFDEILTRVTRHGVPVTEDSARSRAARSRAPRAVPRPQLAQRSSPAHAPVTRRWTCGWRLCHG